MTSRIINCTYTLEGRNYAPAHARRIAIADSSIEAIEAATEAAKAGASPVLALPALVNAHDHARPVRASSYMRAGKPLESWLPWLGLLPAVDPYLAAAVSLGRAALGGVGAAMIHYTRSQGFEPLPREAAEVARAARDVGLRIAFAVALRDQNPLVYGGSEAVAAALPVAARAEIEKRILRAPPSIAEQIAIVDAVAQEAGGPLVDVQYGPNGPQWCSDALLEAIAEASARTGRRVTMHCLETRYQRDYADRTYPEGIFHRLRKIGLLGPRLTLAHCTWARPNELELITEAGATIAVNTGSNLGLRSGIAPVQEMIRRGCKVAMGLDGLAFDETDDGLSEMRLTNALHRGFGFDEAFDDATMLRIVCAHGRLAATGSEAGGTLAAGEPADILLLDWNALDADRLVPDIAPCALLFARADASAIRELIVAGRTVVRDGVVCGIDHKGMTAELNDRLRRGLAKNAAFKTALEALDVAVAAHYRSAVPCC